MDDCVLRGLLSLLACLSQLFLLIKVIFLPLRLSASHSAVIFFFSPLLHITSLCRLTSRVPSSSFLVFSSPRWFDHLTNPRSFVFSLIIKRSSVLWCPPPLLFFNSFCYFLSVEFLACVFCINRMHPEGKTHTYWMLNLHICVFASLWADSFTSVLHVWNDCLCTVLHQILLFFKPTPHVETSFETILSAVLLDACIQSCFCVWSQHRVCSEAVSFVSLWRVAHPVASSGAEGEAGEAAGRPGRPAQSQGGEAEGAPETQGGGDGEEEEGGGGGSQVSTRNNVTCNWLHQIICLLTSVCFFVSLYVQKGCN